MKKTTILILAAALLVAVAATNLLQAAIRIPSSGKIKTIGVEAYWDAECAQPCTNIDWGILEPNQSVAKTIWIKSTSNTNIMLTLTTENWAPANAENYIALTWNRENQILAPNATVEATLTLKVSPSIAGIQNFTFDIIIIGSG